MTQKRSHILFEEETYFKWRSTGWQKDNVFSLNLGQILFATIFTTVSQDIYAQAQKKIESRIYCDNVKK